MIATEVKYGIIPPGMHQEEKSLYRQGDALVLFDTVVSARAWLGLQPVDNKDYYDVVEVAIVMNQLHSKREVVNVETQITV